MYPLRGAAAVAIITLTAAHALADLLPDIIGWAARALVWASILLYAMECLRRTADGYDDPPEVTRHTHYGPVVSLMLLQVVQLVALVMAGHGQPLLWLLVAGMVALLPAVALALAFEDSLPAALHPARWAAAMRIFGVAYLVPVALGVAGDALFLLQSRQPNWTGRSLGFVSVVYLCLLQFHILGLLMHHQRARVGHHPEADQLATASGRDRDVELLQQTDRLVAQGAFADAETLLRERLRERHAPLDVHAAYRRLLHARGDRDALLEHAQIHLALLLAEDRVRPALGLVRACVDQDAQFMPGHPDIAARLADSAAAQGMTQLAIHLARGYPNTWPRDPQAPRLGLLAARLMAERLDRHAEAGVLAAKLSRAYADHPVHGQIDAFLAALHGPRDLGPDA